MGRGLINLTLLVSVVLTSIKPILGGYSKSGIGLSRTYKRRRRKETRIKKKNTREKGPRTGGTRHLWDL